VDTTWLYFVDTASSYIIDRKTNVDLRKIAASLDRLPGSAEEKSKMARDIADNNKKNRYQFTYHESGSHLISRPWMIGNDRYCRTDTLPDFNWELLPDTMHILGFVCQKAISKSISEGSAILRTFTAWYAPEIPVPYGPKYIFGLPGLVLKADAYYYSYRAVEIKMPLKPEETVQLQPCKGFPSISAKEADERARRIMTDMMNMQKLRANP
jgi:GLPGLI family protein